MRWSDLVVGGSAGDGRIGGGGFYCAKSVVGGLTCEWVPKDGSAVGGLAVTVGGCVGCAGSVGGSGCVLILVILFIIIFFGGCGRNNFSGCGFYLFIYKVVLVDVGLCRWWLSALLQRRWLCCCC